MLLGSSGRSARPLSTSSSERSRPGLLVLVFLAALFGEPSSATNLAPTFIYVVFWLGIVPLQVLLGNVWPTLNPWLAIASAAAWVWRALGRTWTPIVAYPERLGVYPAAGLLFAFVALELCYVDPANPRALALAIALYSYATWFGMAAVGRRLWAERGEAFTVYFGLLARIAPFGERDGRLVVRMPFSGLAGARAAAGDARRRRGHARLGRLRRLQPLVGVAGPARSGRGPVRPRLTGRRRPPRDAPRARRASWPASPSSAAATSRRSGIARARDAERPLACRRVRPEPRADRARLRRRALLHPARRVQGQFAVSLASDPFGYGWDLFGTADFAAQSGAALAEHRLVRPGRRARRGPRRRARGRPRPRDYPLPGARGAALAVRAARR